MRGQGKTQKAEPAVSRDRASGAVVVRGRKYTLGEISRGARINRAHVTRIFNGKRNLTLDTAQRISGFLGVPIEALLSLMSR